MFSRLSRVQKWTVFTFLFVPLLSSLISTIHIVDFFELGNYVWMAYVLAAAFEIGSIASAIAITALDKISKFAVWSIFVILVFFQLLGNIFFSFDFVTRMEMNNPDYLLIVQEFLNYFYEFETAQDFKVTLSILIGMPIPLISLAFLKSVVDYINKILVDGEETVERKAEHQIEDAESNALVEEVEEQVDENNLEKFEELDNLNESQETKEEENVEEEVEEEDNQETSEEVEEIIEDEVVHTFGEDGFVEEEETQEPIQDVAKPREDDFIDVVPGNMPIDPNELDDLLSKKEYIEKNYHKIERMEKDLKELWPSVKGEKYDKKP